VSEDSEELLESESGDELFGANTLFMEEEMALLSASRANADVLHENEQRVGADAMFHCTAVHLGEFRDSYLMAEEVVS